MNKQEREQFLSKFNELNQENQKYILAIQQALVFAQSQQTNNSSTNKAG